MTTNIAIWVGAFATIVSLSFLLKSTKIYRYVESAFIGTSAGYWVVMAYDNLVGVGIKPAVQKGDLAAWSGLVLGALIFLRFYKPLRWLSGYSLPLIAGMGTGLAVRAVAQAEIISQVSATLMPLNSIDNIIVIVGTVTCLSYFVFTVGARERTTFDSVMSTSRRIGYWVIVVMFGAMFGNAVMGRISLLIGRFQYLLTDWLGL